MILAQCNPTRTENHYPLLMALPLFLASPLVSPLPLISQMPSQKMSSQEMPSQGTSAIQEKPQIVIEHPPALYATATLPPSSNLGVSTPGSIRVSNSTYHPIRIALLPQVQSNVRVANAGQQVAISQQAGMETLESDPIPTNEAPEYGEPIHWDFVPREGHSGGLVLAVSEGHVKVQPGDVLTAFAQDGSRRYWGPYVVGVTDSPVWNHETQEWSLVLDTPFPF